MNPLTYHRWHYKKIKDLLGVEKGFHAFRHTHATQLIRAGVPIQEVSRRLGHSKVSTTLNIYTHAIEADEDKVLNAVDAIKANIKKHSTK